MITIEKGINIPSDLLRNNKRQKYPWLSMSVGDSFFCKVKYAHISSQSCFMGKKYGMKFRAKRDGDGVRVWRVA